MSACYDTEITLKIKNEEKVVEILKNKIHEDTINNNANYNLKEIPNTLEELIGVFFASHQNMYSCSKDKNVFTASSGFNASYGWELILIQMFKTISSELENGSKFYLGIENDYDKFVIRNNKCVQTH